ncbi:hypothetical protein DFO55_11874 [Grimontella sp. AG753]|nr:hypothetical protein DFO55_11874 [Grimontella sp. AG753]
MLTTFFLEPDIFISRINNCHSRFVLDRLHSQVCRALPAELRGEYIKLINERDDFLSSNLGDDDEN